MVISDDEKRTTAVHEAGHTLISVLISHHDPVHKVTIIPRGPALGVTWYLPKDDRHNLSKEQAESSIAIALGGRIAEEIMFSQMTTGAGNDIEKATENRAQDGVRMGDERKARSAGFMARKKSRFSSGATTRSALRTIRSRPRRKIDQEVRAIVQRQYVKVKDLLTQGRDKLQRLADCLIERETLDAERFTPFWRVASCPRRERVVIRRMPRRTRPAKRSAASPASSAARPSRRPAVLTLHSFPSALLRLCGSQNAPRVTRGRTRLPSALGLGVAGMPTKIAINGFGRIGRWHRSCDG